MRVERHLPQLDRTFNHRTVFGTLFRSDSTSFGHTSPSIIAVLPSFNPPPGLVVASRRSGAGFFGTGREAALAEGRKDQKINVVDEFTQQCIKIRAVRLLKAVDVIGVLPALPPWPVSTLCTSMVKVARKTEQRLLSGSTAPPRADTSQRRNGVIRWPTYRAVGHGRRELDHRPESPVRAPLRPGLS